MYVCVYVCMYVTKDGLVQSKYVGVVNHVCMCVCVHMSTDIHSNVINEELWYVCMCVYICQLIYTSME